MPNPTTINEDQPMTLPETIAKLRALHDSLDFGELRASDYTHEPVGNKGIACDRHQSFIITPGAVCFGIADYFTEIHNALPQLLTALEARESEKPREWWSVAEKIPTADEAVLVWVYNAWEQAYYLKDYWLSSSDSSTIKGMSMSDIWRLMPEAPVIGEGKS